MIGSLTQTSRTGFYDRLYRTNIKDWVHRLQVAKFVRPGHVQVGNRTRAHTCTRRLAIAHVRTHTHTHACKRDSHSHTHTVNMSPCIEYVRVCTRVRALWIRAQPRVRESRMCACA